MGDQQKRNRLVSLCTGCGQKIRDRYFLRVFPDLEWHAECLKCAECDQHLDESCTCFVKDGKTFCKEDYRRLFGIKCAKCQKDVSKDDYVMRTCLNVYHLECFRCEVCKGQLAPGDKFTLRDGYLFCTAEHNATGEEVMAPTFSPHLYQEKRGLLQEEVKSVRRAGSSWSREPGKTERGTRVRTVLSETQLRMLRTCYSANPRPDALVKEQLVEMTGLSSRVIRVWFQNKRCKDKKKIVLMKQKQPDDQLTYCNADELAASPESNDSDLLMSPLDIQSYQAPWKLLPNFTLPSGREQRS